MKPTKIWIFAGIALGISSNALPKAYDPAILLEVDGRVREEVNHKENPVVIFDIDDTLVRTQNRTWRILRETATNPEFRDPYGSDSEKILHIRMNQIRYELSDTLSEAGITHPDVITLLTDTWNKHFFSNALVAADRPLFGAVEYVRTLHQSGATIVYLTGRDLVRMQKGTAYNLKSLGFPVGRKTYLMMKENKDIPDLEFKKRAFAKISTLGTVVGVLENEPININAMAAHFPTATAVFLDVIHSKRPDEPNPKIAWVRNYSLAEAVW